MRAEEAGGALLRAAVFLLPVALLTALALAAWPAWRIELPLWDLWPYAGPAFDAFDPAVIFRAHNEHVPATSAALLWLDRWLAAGTYVLVQGVEIALLVFPAAWTAKRAWQSGLAAEERPATAALWVLALVSVAALQTAAHPFLLQHPLMTALVVAAAALWFPCEQRPSWPAVLIASLLAMTAVVTLGNGIALPFVLLLLEGLERRRLPRPGPAALLLLLPALVLFLGLYLLRESAPALGGVQAPGPVAFLDYLLRLAGAAVGLGLGSDAIARLAGLGLMLLALPPGLALLLRPEPLLSDRLGGLAAALFVMTLGGFLASAWARGAHPGSALYVKYGYYSLLFAGTVAYLNARLLPARWRRLWMPGAVAVLLAINAALLWRSPFIVERQAQRLRAEAAGYAFLLDTPEFCRAVECTEDSQAVLAHFREHGLNVFAWPEGQRLGRPAAASKAADLPACTGGIDQVLPLTSGEGTALLRVDGWIGRRLAPRDALLFFAEDDPHQLLLGFGFASELPSSGEEVRQPWRGYLAPGDSTTIAVVLPAVPCRLGPLAAPQPD